MKVHPCISDTSCDKEDALTFNEIGRVEGVYSVVGYPTCRVIVVGLTTASHDTTNIVLYFNKHTNDLTPLRAANWAREKFKKTKEQVYLSVK